MNQALDILYEDSHLIVCYKPHGIATQSRNVSTPDMERMIKNHLAKSGAKNPYLAVIHRLDQPVCGILVFAKTANAAKALNKQLTTKGFGKHYLALVDGAPKNTSGFLTDYLVKDGRTNSSRVCTKQTAGAKEARLRYSVIERPEDYIDASLLTSERTLLEVVLDTGRHHQIRVQLSHMGCPIVGDTKYNPKEAAVHGWKELKLCAYQLTFTHPVTKKVMTFERKAL